MTSILLSDDPPSDSTGYGSSSGFGYGEELSIQLHQ